VPNCTLGKLTVEEYSWYTMERPWIPDEGGGIGGTPLVSCVPPGLYQLFLHDTTKHPKTWALVNSDLGVVANPIPGMRSDILIHPANWAWELEGCIAPGMGSQQNGQTYMIIESREAMRELQGVVPWTLGHTLEII
jgi:hypothetical protein